MILVFKTNVTTKTKVRQITPMLDRLLPEARWNFDLEDCDNILRIDSKRNVSMLLKKAMQPIGIEIEALPD